MKVKALAPVYGAKRMQAAGILDLIGEHTCWWDCFASSLSMLFAKPKCRTEVVNDLHRDLVNLARVVADDSLSVELFNKVERTVFCKPLYEECCSFLKEQRAAGEFPDGPSVAQAWRYFVASWMGRNGLAATEKELETGFCMRYTSNGGDPATRFRSGGGSIPDWWYRLQGVTILSECGIGLVKRIEDKGGTVVYLDPPYYDKQAKYLHDFTVEQHGELAEACRRFKKTRVCVSYYDCPEVDELYLSYGFQKVARSTTKQMGTSLKTEAPEVLFINWNQ